MMTANDDILMLTGHTEHHLMTRNDGHQLHKQVAAPFTALCNAARVEGFHISIVSAFRSFSRQAAIWQAKLEGKRPVYDIQNKPIDILALSENDRLDATLLYSALPGASRHHWGTELDIYDAAAVSTDYRPTLNAQEYEPDGPFYPLVQWLNDHAADFGFFMPYQHYQGGVAAEPWHLSYRPLSEKFQQALTLERLESCLQQHPICCQHVVLQRLPDIYQRYIQNVCPSHNAKPTGSAVTVGHVK